MSQSVGKKIKEIRKLKDISQKEVAESLHMSESGYAKLEQGVGRVHTEKLNKIAEMLDVEVKDLLNGTIQFLCTINDNGKVISQISSNYVDEIHNHNCANQEFVAKLIQAKDDLIEQQKQQIQLLQDMVEMLKKNQ